jgi:sterol desaturase/sphingolipid hydroxylase (fatty acid hydroxylase superfamily)
MGLLTTEHDRTTHLADIALYATASAVLAVLLSVVAPFDRRAEILALALLGLAAWTLVEYVLHRFVLHGLAPFRAWHAEHHLRPRALIGTPTLLSAALIALLVFTPALLLGDLWRASALTFGLLTGYLLYAIVHHATHHWRADHAWTRLLKRHHALHHGKAGLPSRYGVTSPLWDIVFRTSGAPAAGVRRKPESGVDSARDAAGVAAWENEGGASDGVETDDRRVQVC